MRLYDAMPSDFNPKIMPTNKRLKQAVIDELLWSRV